MIPDETCAVCGAPIVSDDGVWRHVDTGETWCDGPESTDLTRQATPPAEPRPLAPADLVDTVTIADRLHFVHSAVSQWRRRGTDGFPRPLDAPGVHVHVWDWREVEAWARASGRAS